MAPLKFILSHILDTEYILSIHTRSTLLVREELPLNFKLCLLMTLYSSTWADTVPTHKKN